jgi:hypothetical protein
MPTQNFYDHPRYGVVQHLPMASTQAALTASAQPGATRKEMRRYTFMQAVTVNDWNLEVESGFTSTGTQNSNRLNVAISKSLAGTGAVTPFGSAVLGTQADGTVVDGSLTATNFAAGDDLVVSLEAGSMLPTTENFKLGGAVVAFVERFT